MSSPRARLGAGAVPEVGAREAQRGESPGRRQLRRLLRHRSVVTGGILFILFALAALLAPALSPHSPIAMGLGRPLTPPSREFPLGLDSLGRDLLSRVAFGARISMSVGIIVTLLSLTAGTIIGVAVGYYKGYLDRFVMRVMDAFLSFPDILLAMALSAALGMNLTSAVIALGIVYTPRCARLVRSSVLTVVEKEFVQAARAVGARDRSILFKHLLPNVLAPILVQGSYIFGYAIITEAALSFLGVGTQPPNPSWGLMLNDARRYITAAFWYPLVPGCAIVLAVLSVNLLGDGLRDVLDPSLRAQHGGMIGTGRKGERDS